MKKLKLTKFIASTLIVASVLTLNPIGASAEWKEDSVGWWYTEGDSWAVGLRQIDGKWYYFLSSGYMAHDTSIGEYVFGSDGACENMHQPPSTMNNSNVHFKYDPVTGTFVQSTAGTVNSTANNSNVDTALNVTASDESDFYFSPPAGMIIGYFGPDTNLVIPSEIKGVKVKSISNDVCNNNQRLKSVIIPNGVVEIRYCAFAGCFNLTSVTIPDSVTSIGSGAFKGCNFTSITIPDSVTSIGEDAFTPAKGPYGLSAGYENTKFYVKSNRVKQLLINSGVDSGKITVNGQS